MPTPVGAPTHEMANSGRASAHPARAPTHGMATREGPPATWTPAFAGVTI
jgi:hypothetical protein